MGEKACADKTDRGRAAAGHYQAYALTSRPTSARPSCRHAKGRQSDEKRGHPPILESNAEYHRQDNDRPAQMNGGGRGGIGIEFCHERHSGLEYAHFDLPSHELWSGKITETVMNGWFHAFLVGTMAYTPGAAGTP